RRRSVVAPGAGAPDQATSAQPRGKRGGGVGGLAGRADGEASAQDSQPTGRKNGAQVSGGRGGRTAPVAAQRVLSPWHFSAATPRPKRTFPFGAGWLSFSGLLGACRQSGLSGE